MELRARCGDQLARVGGRPACAPQGGDGDPLVTDAETELYDRNDFVHLKRVPPCEWVELICENWMAFLTRDLPGRGRFTSMCKPDDWA